jgi:hypothetical protein
MMLLDPQKEKADMYDCSCIYVFPGASVSRRASEEVRARAGRADCGGRHNTVIILCTDGHTDCLGRRVSMGSWKLEAVLDASCTCKTLGTLDARGTGADTRSETWAPRCELRTTLFRRARANL